MRVNSSTEYKLIEDLHPRLRNWWRVYRDKPKQGTSIQYAVELALRKTRDKTDFSMDYESHEDVQTTHESAPDVRDAEFLCKCWRELSTYETECLTVGTHGMTVRIAKTLIAVYAFGPPNAVEKVARRVWRVKPKKARIWLDEALIFFALRIKFLEKTLTVW